MRRLSSRLSLTLLFATSALALFVGASANRAGATLIQVSFAGTIAGVADNTGSLTGSNIVANVSTFTGSFIYDSSATAIAQSATGGTFPGGPLTVTIDGQHTFSAPTNNVRAFNDDASFQDRFESVPSGNPVTFPFAFNPNDNLFRVSLGDPTSSVFSSLSLPTSLSLASFVTRELFIRTDLNRAAGQLWSISGVVTELSVSVVPEPSTAVLCGLGLIALAGRRRSR